MSASVATPRRAPEREPAPAPTAAPADAFAPAEPARAADQLERDLAAILRLDEEAAVRADAGGARRTGRELRLAAAGALALTAAATAVVMLNHAPTRAPQPIGIAPRPHVAQGPAPVAASAPVQRPVAPPRALAAAESPAPEAAGHDAPASGVATPDVTKPRQDGVRPRAAEIAAPDASARGKHRPADAARPGPARDAIADRVAAAFGKDAANLAAPKPAPAPSSADTPSAAPRPAQSRSAQSRVAADSHPAPPRPTSGTTVAQPSDASPAASRDDERLAMATLPSRSDASDTASSDERSTRTHGHRHKHKAGGRKLESIDAIRLLRRQ